MKTDYSDLEGKEILLFKKDVKMNVIVVGCDYHIGITLVDKENRKRYILCLAGKAAFDKVFGKDATNVEPYKGSKYRRLFSFLVKAIQKGKLDADKFMSFMRQEALSYNKNPTAESCPYN